ncbi:MAG: chromate transporter [Porphyromonas sp.]|nr:chromate transporter [Porphyromonas sp.]
MEKHPKSNTAISWGQLWALFKTFFLIGGFTFGGGYAMLELIREEIVDKHGWLTEEEFIDLFVVAQSLPGVFAVNISIFIGYRLQGVLGGIICGIAATMPSFIIMLIVATYAATYKSNPHVEAVFKGIRPTVVALIIAPCVTVWRALGLGWRWVWIPVVVGLSVWLLGVSPVTVIIASAFLGWLYTMHISQHLPNRNDK